MSDAYLPLDLGPAAGLAESMAADSGFRTAVRVSIIGQDDHALEPAPLVKGGQGRDGAALAGAAKTIGYAAVFLVIAVVGRAAGWWP